MSSMRETRNGETFPHDPSRRGYHAVYRAQEINHCPGCGRTHWYVGRLTAECGFCGTALALADAPTHGTGTFRLPRRRLGWGVLEAA